MAPLLLRTYESLLIWDMFYLVLIRKFLDNVANRFIRRLMIF